MPDWVFRGQTRRYGEKVRMGDGKPMPSIWAYGTGVCVGKGDFSIIYGNLGNALDAEAAFEKKHVVYTDTLGRYTGLTDRNGKRIWEGDVVEGPDFDAEDGYAVIKWDDNTARFVIKGQGLTVDFDNYYGYDIEVFGNIHDNPELLERRG